MASISQEEIIALLTLLGNSLLPSELTEITSVTTDNNYLFQLQEQEILEMEQ